MASETLEFSSPVERAEELTRFLGATDETLGGSLAACLSKGRWSDLIGAVLARLDDVMRSHSDDEIEGIFTLMLSLIGTEAENDTVINDIVKAVTAQPDKASLRLKM
jgi:hypothetical protein